MKTCKTIFFFMIVQFSISQNIFEKSKFSVQVLYGVKIKDYNNIPKPYLDKENVSIRNTNNIGLKLTYFLQNRFNIGLNFNYKSISMSNKKEIVDFDDYDGWFTYYYSTENGYAKNTKLSVLLHLEYHIVQRKKFDCSFLLAYGFSHTQFKSNLIINEANAKLDEAFDYPASEVEFGGGYGEFQYPINEKEALVIFPNLRLFLGSNFYYTLSPKLGLNLELGFGYYNFAGGIFYKIN